MSDTAQNQLLVVHQNHPKANNTNSGTEDWPLRTIQAAADRALPGDTILIHAGIYREEVIPPRGGEEGRPITYQAAPGEMVTVKGSDLFQGSWQRLQETNVYAASIVQEGDSNNPFAQPLINTLPRYMETMKTALPRHTMGQVFLDSQMLDEVDSNEQVKAMPGTWMAAEGGKTVLVHFPTWVTDPDDHIIELAARQAVFRPAQRGLGYITIRGLILEHAANRPITYFWEEGFPPQQGLLSCRSGHHWVIENNVIRFAKSIGLDLGSEGRMEQLDGVPTPGLVGYHRVTGNVISDNGQCGICGLGHIGTEIIGNILERNNNLGASAWEEAAIKTHFYIHGRIEGNLIRGNFCNGIWIDNVYQDVRVTRNVILDNQGAGIFCEMGGGPCLIDNNVIGLHSLGNEGIGGNGIYAHDSGGITIVHNFLCLNASYGIHIKIATERNYNVYPADIQSFDQPAIGEKPCYCVDEHIQNNILVENHRGAINLPYAAEKAGNLYCDHNLYRSENGPLFAINTTAGASAEAVRDAIQAVCVDQENAQAGYLHAGEQFLIPLTVWQQVMQMDQNSATAEIKNMSWQLLHPGPGPWLTFLIDQVPTCPAVAGVDQDFYGRPMPTGNVAPGPFQEVSRPGAFRFRLWPITR